MWGRWRVRGWGPQGQQVQKPEELRRLVEEEREHWLGEKALWGRERKERQ